LKIISKFSSAFLGVILTLFLNFILFDILVPDFCVYHNGKESGFIIKVFYTMDSGFHTTPNYLNIILTEALGIIFGLMTFRFIENKFLNETSLKSH